MIKINKTASALLKMDWKAIKYQNWNVSNSVIEGQVTEEIIKDIDKQMALGLAWEGLSPNHQLWLAYDTYKPDTNIDWIRLTNQLI